LLRRGLLAWAKTVGSSPAHACNTRHPKQNNISTIYRQQKQQQAGIISMIQNPKQVRYFKNLKILSSPYLD